MHNGRENFYEAYWSDPTTAIPAQDTTITQRQHLLKRALQTFLRLPEHGKLTGTILDAGCGNGAFVRFLGESGYDVTGIDIAETALQAAKAGWPHGRFFKGSLEEKLPFDNCGFDAIWCTEVLEHLFDVHATLSEFNRVLQANGILILTVPFHGLLKNVFIALKGFERHYDPYTSHIRFFTKHSLCDSLYRAGFEMIDSRGIGRVWPLFKSMFIVARKMRPSGPPPAIIG